MNNALRRLLVAAVAVSALAGTGAASSYVIGVAVPLSGPRQPRGEALLHSLQMKADEINAAGGVNGHRLELLVRDDQNGVEGARKAAEELTADPRVLAVIGHYDVEPASAAARVYDHAKVPAFLPAIGNEDVLQGSPWVFSGTYDDATEAQTMAAFIKAIRHHKHVVVVHNDAQYGRNLWKAFSYKARRVGLQVDQVEFPATFMRTGKVLPDHFIERHFPKGGGADSIVIFSHTDNGSALVHQLRDAGIKLPIYGSDRFSSGDLVDLLGEDYGDDVHSAFPFMFDFGTVKTEEFVDSFQKRFKRMPTVFGLFAYDGLGMIAEAIAAKGPQRQGIRDYLASRNASKNAYDGASGLLYFDKKGAMVRDTVMGTIDRGDFHPCYTQLRQITSAHARSVLPALVSSGQAIVLDDVPFFKIDVVYAGIEWYRVNQVNIKDLTFEAEFFLWLKWSGKSVDVDNVQFLNEIPGKGYRIEMRRDTVPAMWHGGDDIHWISYRYKGTFVHPYDLHRFPFDQQVLPLLLAHKNKNANKIQLVADEAEIVERPLKEIYPQEWKYLGRKDYAATFRYASAFGNPTYRKGEVQSPYSVYQSDLHIKRILFPYLVTLFLPLAILMAVSLLVLLIPKEQFAPRNGLVMSSLLGVLVYHMAQARALPQVGYLVKADLYFVVAYVLLSMLVLGLNVINLLMAHKKEKQAAKLDKWLQTVFVAAAILAYVVLTATAMATPK